MSEQAGTTQPDRMMTPRLWRLTNAIIQESGTQWRTRRVQAVTNPVGTMAMRVDHRRMGDGVTRFSAAAFVYDATDEGVLTVHRHDVYRGDDELQLESFTRRFTIDPAIGSILRRQKDAADDLEGVREATTVLRSIKWARASHNPFGNDTARTDLQVVLDAVAAEPRDPEAYFHPQIVAAFSTQG